MVVFETEQVVSRAPLVEEGNEWSISSAGTVTWTFSRSYRAATVMLGFRESSEAPDAHVERWVTDANGNKTGVDIFATNGSLTNAATLHGSLMGVA